MNHLAISGLLIFVTSIFSTLFVISKAPQKKLGFTWSLFSLAVALWGFGLFRGYTTDIKSVALFWNRFLNLSAMFIPIFFFHFVLSFINKDTKKKRELRIYYFAVIFSFIFAITFPERFVSNVGSILSFKYYPKPGLVYYGFSLIFAYLVVYSIVLLFRDFNLSVGVRRNQIKYLLFGIAVGFSGGSTTFFPVFGIQVYPLGTYLVPIYVITVSYAILKYRLLDINIALTRAGIFIVVYTLVLGIPFWLGYATKAWWPATALAVILATVGPFIYQHLRRRAEDLILKEQRRYQKALRELSKTMTRIRDLDKLLKMIVLTVVDTVKVSYAGIYLKDEEYKSYRLKHYFPKIEAKDFPEFVSSESSLIKGLYHQKRPLMQEEVGSADTIPLHSGLVIPCFMEDELLGFLVMGAKPNNQIYTADDLLVFETLSYSTSLAIENCRFWKEIEDRQRKARLKEMDTYSYSLAHEIDNPMQVVIGQTNLLKKYLVKEVNLPEAKEKEMEESFEFILEAAHRVSGMVKAIRDFGSPTTGELKPLKIEEVVDSFIRLYLPQLKNNAVSLIKELPAESIITRGEKPELMQVLVILANNSLHAMRYSREKKITIKIEQPNSDISRIIFTDTGCGIKKELLPVIFSPFTTTKASTEGTGMGLYNAKKIIERHKGRLWVESEGENKGTAFFIELPVAKDITPEELEELKFKEGDYKKKKLF